MNEKERKRGRDRAGEFEWKKGQTDCLIIDPQTAVLCYAGDIRGILFFLSLPEKVTLLKPRPSIGNRRKAEGKKRKEENPSAVTMLRVVGRRERERESEKSCRVARSS